jgi:CheY-like chemotaxis protein
MWAPRLRSLFLPNSRSTLSKLPLTSVLLIDDDSTTNFLNQLLLQKTLRVTERVLVAENGQQALAQLAPGAASPAPQLILLDLNMPVMNGWEFLTAYQQLPLVTPRPLVVLLSSSDHDLERARAQQLPVDAFLPKPLTREKMQKLLEQHFSTL